ncbi:MAG: hypothetical protein ABEH90_00050 [Halolamina sp.]
MTTEILRTDFGTEFRALEGENNRPFVGPAALQAVLNVGQYLAVVLMLVLLSGPVRAHGGSLGGSAMRSASIPTWLTIVTGGAIVAGSFLFTSLLTDDEAVRSVNARSLLLPLPDRERLGSGLESLGRAVGVLLLLLVVYRGFVGAATPRQNAAILVVWVGWWAGYSMTTYLIGNTWPVLNPWRTIASWIPSLGRGVPNRFGKWPAVVGLLVLVYIEVFAPLASDSQLLAITVLAYTTVTMIGAGVVGVDEWFERVDPLSAVYRTYGRMAPFHRTEAGIEFRIPGARLTEMQDAESTDGVALIIALLWATSYDGIVSTAAWNSVARFFGTLGIPPFLIYFLALVTGFLVFLGAYRWAAANARSRTETPITERFIEGWFAPALVPIAAGYHVAHFLAYFLGLAPALAVALANPLVPASTGYVLTVPGWFVNVQLSLIILGHVLGVWVAHSLGLEIFPGKIRAIESQYSFIAVMVFYTMTSLWIITAPYVPPAYL